MTCPATQYDSPTVPSNSGEGRSAREQRARKIAAAKGLSLRKLPFRCGGDREDSFRYDLVYERYGGEPAATHLKLAAVEIWLGIRSTTPH